MTTVVCRGSDRYRLPIDREIPDDRRFAEDADRVVQCGDERLGLRVDEFVGPAHRRLDGPLLPLGVLRFVRGGLECIGHLCRLERRCDHGQCDGGRVLIDRRHVGEQPLVLGNERHIACGRHEWVADRCGGRRIGRVRTQAGHHEHRPVQPPMDTARMVAIAGHADLVDRMVGDLAEHLRGDPFECEFHAVAIDVGHPVEQPAQVLDLAETDQAPIELVGGQDAELDEPAAEGGVTVAFGHVRLTLVEVDDHPGFGVEDDLAREVAGAGSVEHRPHGTRAGSLELEQPTRRPGDSTTRGRIVHHGEHRPSAARS